MDVSYFMSGVYEEKINMKMLRYDYVFPTEEVHRYIEQICEIPLRLIVEYIIESPAPVIEAKDVFQFSDFGDATIRLCERILEVNDPGLTHLETGKLLLNDGNERNDIAYTKYGENHAKMGLSVGLIQELTKTYFLSCIGYVYPELDKETRDALLVRLLLRNRLIKSIFINARNEKLELRMFLDMLSDSTYLRRSSNIKRVINILQCNKEYDVTFITKNIII